MAHEHEHSSHGFWSRLMHFLHDCWHHLWNTLVFINSVVFAIVCFYLIYAAGAMFYYLNPWPFLITLMIAIFLFASELTLAGIEEIAE